LYLAVDGIQMHIPAFVRIQYRIGRIPSLARSMNKARVIGLMIKQEMNHTILLATALYYTVQWVEGFFLRESSQY
jgi:hypothetical protein